MAREKVSERAEIELIGLILDEEYPPGSELPGERDLAKRIGVARPALREALQRLARDGWITIQQGRPTQINDFLRDGSLSVLTSLLQADLSLLPGFVPNLLEMWSLIAPTYTQAAVEANSSEVLQQVYGYRGLAGRPQPYVRAQWRLHRRLVELGGNPVYGLVLNSFADFYKRMAAHYYVDPARRADTRAFWNALRQAAATEDASYAADLMLQHMEEIRTRWPALEVSAWIEESLDEDDEEGDLQQED
jgi:GntR family negative regulator for fad regulon and positive regulator of fabA